MVKACAALLLVLNLVVLFDLTLVHFQRSTGSVNLVPLRTIRADWAKGGRPFVINTLGNLGVTAPLGFLVPFLFPRMRHLVRVAGVGLGISLVIETLQYRSGQRVADVDDLLLNMLGAMVGYGFWLSFAQVGRTMRGEPGRAVSPGAESP